MHRVAFDMLGVQAAVLVIMALLSVLLSGCDIGIGPDTINVPFLGNISNPLASGSDEVTTETTTTMTTTTTTLAPMERMRQSPLNQWPMIYAHDAGTGYFKDDVCQAHTVANNWGVNQQKGGFKAQLDCGARALDIRPYVDGNNLYFHHGDVVFKHDFAAAIKDITGWLSENSDEFVYLFISHCAGNRGVSECSKRSLGAIRDAGIQVLSHSNLKSMTLGKAIEKGRLSGGGSALCFAQGLEHNYDDDVECYSGGKACTGNDNDARNRMNHLYSYLDKTLNGHRSNRANGHLWLAQAHWQYGHFSVLHGTFQGGCILKDESEPLGRGVNRLIAEKIRKGDYPHINLLGVDNVCDGGMELFEAMRENVPANPEKLYERFSGLDVAIDLAASWAPAVGAALAFSVLGLGVTFAARRAKRNTYTHIFEHDQQNLVSGTTATTIIAVGDDSP